MNWPDNKLAGVCLHLTSLPGSHGIGELGAAARRFVERISAAGIGVWQFLPIGPTAYADSPYQPLSSFAGNPLLIDIDELVQQRLLEPAEVQPLKDLPAERVDYGRLIPLKTGLLTLAAARFGQRADAPAKAGYERFVARHDRSWLHGFALYRVLKSEHGERSWPDWEHPLAQRQPRALVRAERRLADDIRAVKIVQYFFDRQWRRLQRHAAKHNVLLFGDMPIYIAHDSADAWTQPQSLRLDDKGRPLEVAGVPPDYFSADGQLWGNPVYDWDWHRRNDFRWWIKRCAHAMTQMDLVRIDHFRGFEAFWSVPAQAATAREGSWQPAPGDALFEALSDALGNLPIVAEDLGVITPPVVELREKYGIPGMVVLQFDVALEGFDATQIPPESVCYTGTHDNDTTVGWFHGGPGDTRSAVDIQRTQQAVASHVGGRPETIHLDMIRLAYASAARIAMVPMQDYLGLGSEARMNIPGTGHGNWSWRMLQTQFDQHLSDWVSSLAESTGRSTTESVVQNSV